MIKFTGEIVQDGKDFVVKTEVRLPSFDQAQEFGRWLDGIIRAHVASKGGRLVKESPLLLDAAGRPAGLN